MNEPVERFAFILHPLSAADYARKFPIVRYLPGRFVEGAFKYVPPRVASRIEGVRSPTGVAAEGLFIGLPFTPRTLFSTPLSAVYDRLAQATALAARLGAGIVGLGAFTKIVGDRGVTVAARSPIPVTTGNSYTAATAIEGALLAADRLGIPVGEARAAVVGATGAIGAVCSRILARRVPHLTLVARARDRLEALQSDIRGESAAYVDVSDDPRAAVSRADIVLAVSSATDVLLEPPDLKSGSVVCDVARPRNVSRAIYQHRNDLLVIDGSVIEVPGDVRFNLNFGMPPRMCEACMAETMILALERRYESFTLGREITVAQVDEIARLGEKHGFRLAGFRRGERAIADDEVERIRANARASVRL